MAIQTHETSIPLVCGVDRDSDSLPIYRGIADEQGLHFRFFSSAHELREDLPLSRIMAVVLDVDADPDGLVALQRDLLRNDVPPSVILTTTDRHGDAVIESLGLGAIALLSRPWVSELMSHYLKFADVQYHERRKLFHKLHGLRQIIENLSERQREVLDLAATGMPNKLIATKIDVSPRTVETERSRLLEAFDSQSCADVMINYGEYLVLEQAERIRKRTILQRLGMHAASTMEDNHDTVVPCKSER